jgi:hypothetical protein
VDTSPQALMQNYETMLQQSLATGHIPSLETLTENFPGNSTHNPTVIAFKDKMVGLLNTGGPQGVLRGKQFQVEFSKMQIFETVAEQSKLLETLSPESTEAQAAQARIAANKKVATQLDKESAKLKKQDASGGMRITLDRPVTSAATTLADYQDQMLTSIVQGQLPSIKALVDDVPGNSTNDPNVLQYQDKISAELSKQGPMGELRSNQFKVAISRLRLVETVGRLNEQLKNLDPESPQAQGVLAKIATSQSLDKALQDQAQNLLAQDPTKGGVLNVKTVSGSPASQPAAQIQTGTPTPKLTLGGSSSYTNQISAQTTTQQPMENKLVVDLLTGLMNLLKIFRKG